MIRIVFNKHAFYNRVPLHSPLRNQEKTSSDHSVVSATCSEIASKTSRFNPILSYLALGSPEIPEILSLDKEADKASNGGFVFWIGSLR